MGKATTQGNRLRLRAGTLAGLTAMAVGPALAADAGGDAWADDTWGEEEESGLPFDVSGFVELAGGYHLRDNEALDDDYNLAELRGRLEISGHWQRLDYRVKADGVADGVEDEVRGELREARASFPVGERLDMRVGRQVLTWGTGDLLFINDLFPKDWQSFLTGRDSEYLKAPSDAVRGTWYGDAVTLDVVWTPVFEPDVYPNGDRLSYFDTQRGRQTAASLPTEDPEDFPDDGELATRLSGRIGSTELAGYFYRGFFPRPGKQIGTGNNTEFTHARLNAYGASVRDRIGPGIASAEVGYYDSVDYDSDRAMQVPNDEARLLLGYDWELVANLNVGFQYYVEWLQDYDELKDAYARSTQADERYRPEEYRDIITNRLTYAIWRDNLVWSLFTYYSPADEDYYARPSVHYRVSDELSYTLGGNLFGGDADHTFYGQFEQDSNLYGRIRYRF